MDLSWNPRPKKPGSRSTRRLTHKTAFSSSTLPKHDHCFPTHDSHNSAFFLYVHVPPLLPPPPSPRPSTPSSSPFSLLLNYNVTCGIAKFVTRFFVEREMTTLSCQQFDVKKSKASYYKMVIFVLYKKCCVMVRNVGRHMNCCYHYSRPYQKTITRHGDAPRPFPGSFPVLPDIMDSAITHAVGQ